MYRYDQYDQQMVDARVEEFRDQARRRLEGTLSEDQFKPLRLMNGLYLQLHAYMLRVAIPYGTLSGAQMRVLADVAASVGLDRSEALEVLSSGSFAEQTREAQQFWTSRGVSGVPSMIFEGKYLVTGAQGADNYAQMLRKVLEERDAAA
jgi:sulfite reductase beta subunit-like hemoprotein